MMKDMTRFLLIAAAAVLLTVLPALTVSAGTPRYTMENTPTPTTETAEDENTPTPTPEDEATPTPTPEDEATPTPSEATPTPTPEDEATPTPTHSGNTYTSAPTKKPGIYTEPTRDPYDSSTRVTNPPPTMASDVTLPADIATLVPEEETPAPAVSGSVISNDPTAGLIILFSVLILLLALDIAAILWRKNLGFSGLLNGGVAVRKVEQSMESDEQTVDDDTP